MIPETTPIEEREIIPGTKPEPWQATLAAAVRDPQELFELLQLDSSKIPASHAACRDFKLLVPRPFIARMQHGDWQDPLLQQVLPQAQELSIVPGFSDDPLDERNSNPAPGLIHKYQGRVLLIVSGGCAVNCRYCFRRHFPYEDNNPSRKQWQQSLDYISQDSSIKEVILSGGDPLAASDTYLAELVSRIAAIKHVTTLRIHTRLPIVIPSRITDSCLRWMTATRLQPVLVIHSNHANELDDKVAKSLARLRQAGVILLNQSVLLAGINDQLDSLKALSQRLFELHVLPYYLHQLDSVQGAAHFQVSDERAKSLLIALRSALPGYLVPKLVRECPDADAKLPVR